MPEGAFIGKTDLMTFDGSRIKLHPTRGQGCGVLHPLIVMLRATLHAKQVRPTHSNRPKSSSRKRKILHHAVVEK